MTPTQTTITPEDYLCEPTNRAARKQRADRGFAESDCWSLDNYLAGVIAGGCRTLIERSNGHPGNLKDFDAWAAVLNQIATGMEMYVQSDMTDLPEFQKSLELLVKWWGHLWD